MATPTWLRNIGSVLGKVVSVVSPALGELISPSSGLASGTATAAQKPTVVTPATAPTVTGPGAGFLATLPPWALPVGAAGLGLVVILILMKKKKKR